MHPAHRSYCAAPTSPRAHAWSPGRPPAGRASPARKPRRQRSGFMTAAPQPRQERLEGRRNRTQICRPPSAFALRSLSSTTQIAVRPIDTSRPEKNSIARLLRCCFTAATLPAGARVCWPSPAPHGAHRLRAAVHDVSTPDRQTSQHIRGNGRQHTIGDALHHGCRLAFQRCTDSPSACGASADTPATERLVNVRSDDVRNDDGMAAGLP